MYQDILRMPDQIITHSEGGVENADDVKVDVKVAKDKLDVFVTSQTSQPKYIRLRWHSKEQITGSVLADDWERGYGDLGWKIVNPLAAMPWYFLMKNDTDMSGFGVKVRPGAFCFWQVDPKGITLWLDVRNGGEGVQLNGRNLHAATVVSSSYDLNKISSFDAAHEFCKTMCDDPLAPETPAYGSNNWYYAYGFSSREEIMTDTDYLMSMCKDNENPPFMVVDDGWEIFKTEEYCGGPWVPSEKFGDMKTLADYIKDKGAKPGIWTRFLYDKREEVPAEWRLASGFLDPSRQEVLDQIRDDIDRIGEWGYQLLKYDYTSYDIFNKWGFEMNPLITEDGWHFADRTKTTAEIVVNMYQLIYDTCKKYNMVVLGCNTVGHLCAGLVHINRVGDDTSGKLFERSLRMGVNNLCFRMPQHKAFFDIDADCLGIMETLPWEQNRLWAKLLANSGTPLFVSAKPGVLNDAEKEELAGYFAINSKQNDVAKPVDWDKYMFTPKWEINGKDEFFDWDYENGLRDIQGQGNTWDLVFLQEMCHDLW